MGCLIICIVSMILCSVVSADSPFHISLDARDLECIRELGLDSKTVVAAFGENFKVEEENHEINEFFKCAWTKAGFLDKNNEISKDKIKKWLTEWDIRDLHEVYQVNNVKNLDEVANDCINMCFLLKFRKTDDFALKTYNCLLDCLLWKRLSRK